MASFTVKRSMSPDGKIDAVSVELSFEAEVTDSQTVLDAIATTDAYASYAREQPPAPRTQAASAPTPTGAQETVTGTIQAVYDGEPSKTSGKNSPGAIIIAGTKVKTFDKKDLTAARAFKEQGAFVEATFVRNEKYNANDLKSLKAATQ